MTTEAPPRIPGPPKPGTPKPNTDTPEQTPRRMSKHAIIGATPLALGGIETVGVNYGTPGLIAATALTALGGVAYGLRRVWLPLLGLRAATPRNRVRNTGTGRGGVLSRLRSSGTGRPRSIGGALRRLTGGGRSGGRKTSPSGRRGPLGKLGGKARGLFGGRSAKGGRRGGFLGKGASRGSNGKRGPLRRAAGALGKAARSARSTAGRTGRALTGRNKKPGSGSSPRGAAGRGPGRTKSGAKGSTGTRGRGVLGRITPKGRAAARAKRAAAGSKSNGAGKRGLFGRRTSSGTKRGLFGRKTGSNGGGRGRGLFGKKGSTARSSGSTRRRGLLAGRRSASGGVAGKRAARAGRRRNATQARPGSGRRPQTKRQRRGGIPDPRGALHDRLERNRAERRNANDALTFAEHHNRNRLRPAPNEPTEPPAAPQQSKPASTGRTGTMPNPFENVEEAMASTPPLEVENARTVMDFHKHAPEAAEAWADLWANKFHEPIKEGLPISPTYAEAMDRLTAAMRNGAEDVSETGGEWERAHEEKLRRINDPEPNDHKWDILKNQD